MADSKVFEKKVTLGATLVASSHISLKLTRGLGYNGVLIWLTESCLMIQGLRSCMTLCSLMRNGSTYAKNLKNIICYPKKMNPIGLVRTRITSLGSCSCVLVLGQGLGMGIVFLMVGLCFPLVRYEPAMRGNERTGRVCGDLVMKPITSITRDVIREFMINQVLSAIRAKWPREDVGKPIFIQ